MSAHTPTALAMRAARAVCSADAKFTSGIAKTIDEAAGIPSLLAALEAAEGALGRCEHSEDCKWTHARGSQSVACDCGRDSALALVTAAIVAAKGKGAGE